MRISRAVLLLCAVVGVLAAAASVVGLFAAGGYGPCPFETLRGERAEIWGRGLYRYDTVLTAAGSRATDLVTLLLGLPLLSAALTGEAPPGLGPYSTEFTMVLDLAVIAPAAFVAGTLILRRRPLGHLIALSLLVLEVLLAPQLIAQTAAQLLAGVRFTVPEVIGPMGGFVVLAVASGLVLVSVLRAVGGADDRPGERAGH